MDTGTYAGVAASDDVAAGADADVYADVDVDGDAVTAVGVNACADDMLMLC